MLVFPFKLPRKWEGKPQVLQEPAQPGWSDGGTGRDPELPADGAVSDTAVAAERSWEGTGRALLTCPSLSPSLSLSLA